MSSMTGELRLRRLLVTGVLVITAAVGLSCWLWLPGEHDPSLSHQNVAKEKREKVGPRERPVVPEQRQASGDVNRNGSQSEGLPARKDNGSEVTAAAIGALIEGDMDVETRVSRLQSASGTSFSSKEREAAIAFLAGKGLPEGIGRGSINWLSDELLTILRKQDPPWKGLAAALGDVAFQPEMDPVVRDYIMQHLGHIWEQTGAQAEIEKALWRGIDTKDETTPGTALLALSRGYARDRQDKPLMEVHLRALNLAADLSRPLAVRVTALSIAGDGGGSGGKELAENLIKDPSTPVILRKVAERVIK